MLTYVHTFQDGNRVKTKFYIKNDLPICESSWARQPNLTTLEGEYKQWRSYVAGHLLEQLSPKDCKIFAEKAIKLEVIVENENHEKK